MKIYFKTTNSAKNRISYRKIDIAFLWIFFIMEKIKKDKTLINIHNRYEYLAEI